MIDQQPNVRPYSLRLVRISPLLYSDVLSAIDHLLSVVAKHTMPGGTPTVALRNVGLCQKLRRTHIPPLVVYLCAPRKISRCENSGAARLGFAGFNPCFLTILVFRFPDL